MCETLLVLLSLALGGDGEAGEHAPATRQQEPSQAFRIDALRKQLEQSNRSYLPFLNVPTLRTGLYRLAAGAVDRQSPHAQDEVYHVVEGKAVLEVGSKRHPAQAGSILFVKAGVPHRFVDIKEDLTVLVFFSEALTETGGMAAGPRPVEQTPYPETSGRGSARIFYWFGPGSAGQLEIDHGLPPWKGAYEAFLTKPQGRRWRFGQNFWTRLDTNIDLTIGDTKVPAGYYYLVLENHSKKGLQLVALDPSKIKAGLLDAYQAPQTSGGLEISLTKARAGSHASRLKMRLDVDRTQKDHASLTILFGPHRLSAPILMHPRR